jgi:predicted amidohydrolase
VSQYFNFIPYTGEELDEASCSTFDLGGRCLDIFHIPGHYPDHIAVYDRSSGLLLTGDFIYPGRLYVYDRTAFHDSMRFLNKFCEAHRGGISAVLGSHIEMTNTPGFDYPDGTFFQPDESPLALTESNVATLCQAVEEAHRLVPSVWGVLNLGFCKVVPTDLFSTDNPYIAQGAQTCVALISELYFSDHERHIIPQDKLTKRLMEAKQRGASVALLPELPMDKWYPRNKISESTAATVDTFCVTGMLDSRIVAMSKSAHAAGITLVGGAIMRAIDLPEGMRDGLDSIPCNSEEEQLEILDTPRNVTMIFSPCGELIGTHMKRSLPCEEGFWENDYFSAAPSLPSIKRGVIPGFPMCVQTCSDIMRPASAQIMSSLGSCVIMNPRATEESSSERWQGVCVGIAVTTASYVLSVPRPKPEEGLLLGGDAFCISPSGKITSSSSQTLLSSNLDPITLCHIDAMEIGEARVKGYPGYLTTRAADYGKGWKQVADYFGSFH